MKRWLVALIAIALLLVGCGGAPSSTDSIAHTARYANPAPEGHKPAFSLRAIPHRAAKARAASVVATVQPAPRGPSGTWKVQYADAFGAPLGSVDTTLLAHQHDNGCCSNGDEIMSERPSKVRLGPNGLELLCSKESTVSGKPYTCGGVSTAAFKWRPGQGQTIAFEAIMQLPPRDLGEDPGWWSTDTQWTDELDMIEAWEWNHVEYYAGDPVWKAVIGGATVQHESYKLLTEIPNPETGLHTYTTVINANNTVEEWIDGVHRWNLPAPSSINKPMMSLILTHALRVASNLVGTNSFTIRSIAVYEDSAHAGVGIEHGGIAPGTTIAGTEPPKEETTPTETTPPPTETTPPPPPPSERPAAPTGVVASSISTSTSPGLTVKWSAVTGATSYKLYRAGNENIEGRKPGEQWGPATTGTQLSNHLLVTLGGWYCYRAAALNAAGQGPYSAPTCATA